MTTDDQGPLRFTTWLAPGLPLELFETIAARVSDGLGRRYELSVEPKISGPLSVEEDRFATGRTDIGFICPPSYLWLVGQAKPSVRLVPWAPIYDDPRNEGRPTYGSDVVVRADSDIESFADLAGRRVGFNERASLSGFVSLLARLDNAGLGIDFFGELRQVGSHRRALELIQAGDLDAAAIDVNVFRAWLSERPVLSERAVLSERDGAEHRDSGPAVRSVEMLGPYPVQPVVVRADAPAGLLEAVAEQLARPDLAEAVRAFGLLGFGAVTEADYEAIRPAVDRAMNLAPS